jgi:hypothetical protein
MKIIIDADASPVKDEVIQLAQQYKIPVTLVSSIAHYSFEDYPEFVESVYVEKGADCADFKIVQLAEAGDIVITQDYGLASLLLPKGCIVAHHKGYLYTKENIERLLQSRHVSAQMRKSGHRTKGPKPFTTVDRQKFLQFLDELLSDLFT